MSAQPGQHDTALWRSVGVLIVLAALATGALSLVEQHTRERIDRNRELQATRMVAEVLPGLDYTNAPGLDSIAITDAELLGTAEPLRAYLARRLGTPVAVAVTVIASDGYVGPIRLLVGIDAAGTVLAVRALEHRETPGLGDQIDIDKTDWISAFTGRSLANTAAGAWALRADRGEFQALTGATVTSRAVVAAVRNALLYYRDAALLEQAAK